MGWLYGLSFPLSNPFTRKLCIRIYKSRILISQCRHGWGCDPDPTKAVKYLTLAASNAAGIEDLALKAGMTKGGAAKGELVLAIFELANCFRHGWGVNVDKFAAQRVRSSKSPFSVKYFR
jgi:hypothetical protein